MTLKNLIGVVAGLVAITSCTGETKEYTIHGEITGMENGMIYLRRYEDKAFTDVDSALVSNGKFVLRGTVSEPLIHGIATSRDSRYPLLFFLDKGEADVRIDEGTGSIKVTGSPVNDLYFENAPLIRVDNYRLDSLVQVHPASPVGAYFLMRDFAWRLDLKEIKGLRSQFDQSLEGSFYINQIDSLIGRLERLQVGATAPDFTLPDTDGNPVSVSSFRGKYVLLDFWASWCPDCRRENPNLVAAYHRFKGDNFAVLGVSLDRTREAWLKAIEKDKLEWVNVSDLKDWNSEVAVRYAIRWIPTSYLISPDGKILAVGLEGEDLVRKLAEVLEPK